MFGESESRQADDQSASPSVYHSRCLSLSVTHAHTHTYTQTYTLYCGVQKKRRRLPWRGATEMCHNYWTSRPVLLQQQKEKEMGEQQEEFDMEKSHEWLRRRGGSHLKADKLWINLSHCMSLHSEDKDYRHANSCALTFTQNQKYQAHVGTTRKPGRYRDRYRSHLNWYRYLTKI